MTPGLRGIESVVEGFPEVCLAVLFGSTARQQPNPRDLDIGLATDRALSAERRAYLEAELGRATGTTVDIVWLDKAPPLLRFEIARDGIPLHERQPHAWAEFRYRAMRDWWDWAPTARQLDARAVERLLGRVEHGSA